MSIKVLVTFNEAFVDLQDHLAGLSVTARNERFRVLASLGLLIQQGKMVAGVNPRMASATPPQGEYLKFPVFVNGSTPDLFADIERMPARLRAERLRSLAAIGLSAQSAQNFGSVQIVAQAPVVQPADAGAVTVEANAPTPASAQRQEPAQAAAPESVSVKTDVLASESKPSENPTVSENYGEELIKPGKRVAWLAKSLGR